MAKATLIRHARARDNAHLVDEGKESSQLDAAEARKLASAAQDAHHFAVAHRWMRPAPTPAENARRVPGPMRFSSLSAPKLSPCTSTANAVMPSARARSARAATNRRPNPRRCQSPATTNARSARPEPASLSYTA